MRLILLGSKAPKRFQLTTAKIIKLIIVVVASSLVSQGRVFAKEEFSADVKGVLALPEHKIDTGLAALFFAKEIYPSIDVNYYSQKIDGIARNAKLFIDRHGKYDPDSIVRALNTFYYREWGVKYDRTEGARSNAENYFINHIIDKKIGQCTTIPMLYMAVAQRLGYPIYAVTAPEHNFLRFVDERLQEQNIELSGTAGYSSNTDYAYRLNISQKGIDSGAYLRTLSRRQYLGILLQQNALVFLQQSNSERALLYFEEAYKIDDRNVYAAKNLSSIYRILASKERRADRSAALRAKAIRYALISERLGWTEDPDANNR